jgi:hypothetical protein
VRTSESTWCSDRNRSMVFEVKTMSSYTAIGFIPETLCRRTGGRKVDDSRLERRARLMLLVRTDLAARRIFFRLLLFSIASLTSAQQNKATQPGSWSGVLVSSACNADEAFNESPECARNVPGAKLALYDDTSRVMYSLEPQGKVSGKLGDAVTIRGTLDGDTIQLASIELMSIGLAVGQKAPAFSVRDQLGRTQTLDTLKGANGTVLLFFRSADW